MAAGEATAAAAGTAAEDRQIPPAPRHLTVQPARMIGAPVAATLPQPFLLPFPPPETLKASIERCTS
jgi:hypothetical protein